MTTVYHVAPLPATSGIYKITCTSNKMFYIGSAVNLRNRWYEHRKHLRSNKHGNSKLQRAFNKYGIDAFTFEVLELVLPMSLTAREQYWFNKLKPFGKIGFNIVRTAGSTLGREVSAETREKIGAPQRGRPSQFRGKTHTPESLEKMSVSHRGQPAHNRGKATSPEIRERQRIARIGSMKTLIITDPDGTESVVTGISHFCKEHGLIRHHLMEVARGECSQHHGYKARYPEPTEG